MKLKGIISATLLSAALAAPTYACTSVDEIFDASGVLFSQANLNKNLTEGQYEFAQYSAHFGSSFSDRWKFTVAEDSTASISIFDIEIGFDLPGLHLTKSELNSTKNFNIPKIFDTKNLTFSVYDSTHHLLGEAHEDETLTGLSLAAGEWYTLKVSGKVGGLFGSAYFGTLDTQVAAVPLGDSAPMLGSALALLAFSYRKRLARNA